MKCVKLLTLAHSWTCLGLAEWRAQRQK